MGIQDIIAKVQKLRALSASANINEASNAAAVAERLIAEYRLSEAELTAENKISAPIIEAQQFLYETGKVVQWKSLLALLLSKHYDVYVYNNGDYSTGRKFTRYAMIGRESDIQVLQYNYEYLTREIQQLCDLLCFSDKRGISVERNSFCQGAVDGIVAKIREEKKAVETNATSAALVVLNNKYGEAKKEAYQKHHLTQSKNYSHSQFDGSAYARGKTVGGKIQINSGLSGSSSQNKYLK